MKPCASCGNEYDKAFTVNMGGQEFTFDSFECAIHKLAPRCTNCGVPIIGHGVESSGNTFCSVHCADNSGEIGLKDRQ